MSEIEQYFSELRRDIKNKPEVASVKTKTARRQHPEFEKREYYVFLKSAYTGDKSQIKFELGHNLQVKTESVDEKDNADILVTATFDAKH